MSIMNRILLLALFFFFAAMSPTMAMADGKNVQFVHQGLQLNANLTMASGKSLKDGAVLITHGTLAHNGMQIIAAMQKELAGHGLNSLAISLGYGLSNRTGMYECQTPHRHIYTDALDEIGVWVAWLKTQGVSKLALMGHSRGGAQTAWFAAERFDPIISKVVLLAPMVWSESAMKEQYRNRFGKELSEPLAKARKMKPAEMMTAGFLACPDAQVSAGSFLSYYASEPRFDTPALLASIKAPVLVIAADNDQLIKGLPERVKPLADGKKVSLTVISDADHFFNNFAAEDAAEAAAKFLKD
ncbi:Alpha/beta hydrolase fold protein [Rhodospirillaceae bacterium LM-1]|nr:Alpha/beta hydrolase fold protein [Rhodospirillaceae bacterium LM-1]